ncbi:MAG: hypothetical protein M0R80_01225 [Proteobacteria bacterium]|jgi:hypothetical protein|nr:hypothetical protein [Pseudomonadota bacterium]
MEYTLIGGPLFSDGAYYASMTIKKLLRDQRNCWSLEIPGYAEEHLCVPFYGDDDGDCIGFDELASIPELEIQQGLFDECYSKHGTLVIGYEYEEESNLLRWHQWIKYTRSVTFVFRKRENNVIKKVWIFHDIKPHDIEMCDSIRGLDDVSLEFHFGRFENRDLQPPLLKYNEGTRSDNLPF